MRDFYIFFFLMLDGRGEAGSESLLYMERGTTSRWLWVPSCSLSVSRCKPLSAIRLPTVDNLTETEERKVSLSGAAVSWAFWRPSNHII